jgi:hypothetical protein
MARRIVWTEQSKIDVRAIDRSVALQILEDYGPLFGNFPRAASQRDLLLVSRKRDYRRASGVSICSGRTPIPISRAGILRANGNLRITFTIQGSLSLPVVPNTRPITRF